MANTLLNIAGAFINQANTGDVKGAVASRGQADANAHEGTLEQATEPRKGEREREIEREREREGETTTKFFRPHEPFLSPPSIPSPAR